ncbi:MAG: hypothetical protein RI101_05670 [Nitrospira sp.]|jgi:methyl-accepting chemotaxis protein|nr:hypothetical protein [Nitrospira sp.]
MTDSSKPWKAFASCALPLIPVLIRQMNAVTEQTETAALNLMTNLQAISQRASRQAEEAIHLGQADRNLDAAQREQLLASVRESKQRATELSSDVGRIVMALQFQDITRQKLEHVEHALTHLRDHLQHLVDGKPDQDLADSLSLLKDLEHSYTMEAERRIHAAARGEQTPPAPVGQAGGQDESVTLF